MTVVSQDHRGQINISFRILWPFLLPPVTPLLPPSSPPPSQPAPERKQIQNGYNVLPNRVFKHLYLPCSSSAAQVKHHRLAPCLTLLCWKQEWDILYWIWNLFLFPPLDPVLDCFVRPHCCKKESQYGMSVSKCCRVPYLILIAGFTTLLLPARRKPLP